MNSGEIIDRVTMRIGLFTGRKKNITTTFLAFRDVSSSVIHVF